MIWAPISTLTRVAEEGRVLLGFGVVALYAALGLISSGLTVLSGSLQPQFEDGAQSQPLPPGFEDFFVYFEIFTLVLSVVMPFVLWLVVSGLMQLVTRFFGGTGPFSGMLAAVGVAHVPFLISAVVSLPLLLLLVLLGPENAAATIVTSLSSLIGVAVFVWFAVLVVMGAALARRVGYGQSAGSCAISCAGLFGLILIVIVVVTIAVVAVTGAATGGLN